MMEISVKGKWVQVPSIRYDEQDIITTGMLVKVAHIHDEAWLERDVKRPDQCVNMLKAHGVEGHRVDLFTFSQKVPDANPKYAYYSEWESIAVARLDSFTAWWDELPQETRKNVRRAAKRGVTVIAKQFSDELVEELIELNDASPIRQGRRYPHYGKPFQVVKKDYSSFVDRSDFLCAYSEKEIIGFLKIVYRDNIASVLNLCTKENHYDKKPANALIAAAMERCAARGALFVTYGLFNYGNKRNTPITQFKVRNGFEEMLMPRYYVPLTRLGEMYLRMGFHRGILGLLPNGLIASALNLRSMWYHNAIGRCSSKAEQPNRNRQMGCSNPPAGSST